MLGLISADEMQYIFTSPNSNPNFFDEFRGISERGCKVYKKRSNFFKPYEKGSEFVGDVIAPIVYLGFGKILAGFSLIVAPLSAIVGIGLLLFAGKKSLLGEKDSANSALNYAGTAFKFTGVALLTAVISTFLAVLSFFNCLASLVTRSLTTLVSNGADCSETAAPQHGI